MATAFQSAHWRTIWIGAGLNYLSDAIIVGLIFGLLKNDYVLWWAIILPLGLYTFRASFALYNGLKRLAWFYVFERENRINDTIRELNNLRMPAPKQFYNDVDEYLTDAAMSSAVPKRSRLTAGITLGMLASMRQLGPRMEAIILASTIEAALQRMPPEEEPENAD